MTPEKRELEIALSEEMEALDTYQRELHWEGKIRGEDRIWLSFSFAPEFRPYVRVFKGVEGTVELHFLYLDNEKNINTLKEVMYKYGPTRELV